MASKKTHLSGARLALSVLFLTSAALAAPENSKEEIEHELSPYVVVATRTPVEMGELSISTSFIDAATLEQRQYFSLSDVLKELPGTAVVQNGHTGAVASLFTRGTESNHTAIFLNGRRLPAGTFGQYDLSSLGIENLSSVEFVRGPSSSLYGSDAIGGVIDLRSREASPNEQSNVLTSEYGSFNSLLGKYETLIGGENFSVSAGVSYFETENDRPNSDYERTAGNLYASYAINPKLKFDFQGLYYDSKLGVPGDERYPIGTLYGTYPASEINETEATLLSPGLHFQANENFQFSTFYSRSKNTFEANDAPFASNFIFKETVDELNCIANFSPEALPVLFTGGLSYLKLQYDRQPNDPASATTPFEYDYHNQAIFGQAIWDISDSLRFIGSMRYDRFDRFKNTTTGNAEFSYYFPSSDTRLFLKYGTGMAPAEANDLARLEGKLDPEESQSWEIGFKQNFSEPRLGFGMIYFHSKINNLVDDDGAWPSANYEVVDTEQKGVESELTWQITPTLSSRVAYTYLQAEVSAGTYFSSAGPGVRLIRRPKHSIAANLDWEPSQSIRLGMGFQAAIDREEPAGTRHEDYELFRIYGDWQLNSALTLYGRVENLFDQHFTYTRGFSNSGCAAYLGARLKF
jgi:vitamin B12 transporter